MAMQHLNVPPDNHVKVLDGQGWVGLIDHLGSETTIVNAARVSFGKIRTEMNENDVKLLKYLIENRHTSPLEHLVFTFSVHCPLFIRGQWHRHRTWSYNEISRRYTDIDLEFYTPPKLRRQAESDRQASVESPDFDDAEMRAEIAGHNRKSLARRPPPEHDGHFLGHRRPQQPAALPRAPRQRTRPVGDPAVRGRHQETHQADHPQRGRLFRIQRTGLVR